MRGIARHGVFDVFMDSLDPKSVLQRLDVVLDSHQYATKLNVVFDFVSKGVEMEVSGFTIKTFRVLDRSKLVAIREKRSRSTKLLSDTDVFESCTRKRANKKRKTYQLNEETFLLHYSKEIPDDVSTLFYQIRYWEILPSKVLEFRRKPENRTTIVFVLSGL